MKSVIRCDDVYHILVSDSVQKTCISRRMFNRVNAVEENAIPLDKLVSFVYRL